MAARCLRAAGSAVQEASALLEDSAVQLAGPALPRRPGTSSQMPADLLRMRVISEWVPAVYLLRHGRRIGESSQSLTS